MPIPHREIERIPRWTFLNMLIERRGYQSFLEIGVRDGATMRRIRCPRKVGVDPMPREGAPEACNDFFRTTSNAFFATNEEHFDLVFVDGLHIGEQALSDVLHALECLNEGGTIVMHDCNPQTEAAQMVPKPHGQRAWNGTAWKALVILRAAPGIWARTLDTAQGLGVVRPSDCPSKAVTEPVSFDGLTWNDLQANREYLLGLHPIEDIELFL